jgi:ATP-dependent Zn protease
MLSPSKLPRKFFWILIDRFCPERGREQRIAYHEAGHAVVAWASGHTVELVSVSPPPPRTKRRGDESDVAAALAVAHGGMKAEERLTANPKPSDGADTDLDKIEWLVRDHRPPNLSEDEFRSSGLLSAKKIVAQHWKVIEAVAAALLDGESITEARFAEIVRQVGMSR